MLTDKEIESAKESTKYTQGSPHHEHNDCIRMAYEWLDAQKKIKTKQSSIFAIKHLVEKWCGRYVSASDVEVAAHMHPEIHGSYPFFNISSRLTEPSKARLSGYGEAFKHQYNESHKSTDYKYKENG